MREYEPIIIKVKENGLLDIDEDKLKELLKDAFTRGYNEGFEEGKKSIIPGYVPLTPSPLKPYEIDVGEAPDWYKFGPTCTSAINTNVRSDENAN